ncbi:MAG: STAS domain-containing protein [Terracidiphilus sp.]|nr:STAS domain-containing protein [Terracidiphilus sp.]
MTSALFEPGANLNFQAIEPEERNERVNGELVRGQEARLLEGLETLVLKHSVALDLAGVERIDAAGIAALVKLYRSALAAGHQFRIANPSAHVAQILTVVGLDGYLLSHNAVENSYYGACLRRPAA